MLEDAGFRHSTGYKLTHLGTQLTPAAGGEGQGGSPPPHALCYCQEAARSLHLAVSKGTCCQKARNKAEL